MPQRSESDQRLLQIRAAYRAGDTALLAAALRDPDHRRMAVRYLANLGADDAGPEILRLLAASDPRVRRAAVRALGTLRYAPAMDRLLEAIGTDEDRATREWALVAVGDLGGARAYAALAPMLEAPQVTTRRAAAIALGRLGDPAAIPLIKAASHRESPLRRKPYREALRLLTNPPERH